jgi:hypothetical protein
MHLSRTASKRAITARGYMIRRPIRRWCVALCLLVFGALMPVSAFADVSVQSITAPTLTAPAIAYNATVGGSVKFAWDGALQGDPTQVARSSFFRVEIARAADVPAGLQSAWPTLDSFRLTVPGQATNTITAGVPDVGDYRWRVCAWGIADVNTANEIAQLPGGCSSARSFTSQAAAVDKGNVAMVHEDNKVMVQQPVQVITKLRPTVVDPQPKVIDVPATPVPKSPATFTDVVKRVSTSPQGSSSVSLAKQSTFTADSAANRGSGVAGALANGLGASLPGIPIPFWTLALLAASIPLARRWRRNVLQMFEWPEDAVAQDELQLSAGAPIVKRTSWSTDTPENHDPEDARAA